MTTTMETETTSEKGRDRATATAAPAVVGGMAGIAAGAMMTRMETATAIAQVAACSEACEREEAAARGLRATAPSASTGALRRWG